MDDQGTAALRDVRAPARRRPIAPVIAALAVLALIGGGVVYWLQARQFETTDDAFIDADISQVSAQTSGRIVQLLVRDNQRVAAGQVLAVIDPRAARIAVQQMQANRDQAAAQLAQARATLAVRAAELAQAGAQIRVVQADRVQSRRDLARYLAINPRAISAQAVDQARAADSGAQARLDAARDGEAASRAELAQAQPSVAAAEAALRTAEANLADARLRLSYTEIRAPTLGRVAQRTVQLGNYVVPGQSLLAIVQPHCWVTANFKETQLARMHPGQAASVTVDAFPDLVLRAHVGSLQSGTGSVFSSLPAENATGNYVKIVQRLPVKLLFDSPACDQLHLAPGMSAEPAVRVR